MRMDASYDPTEGYDPADPADVVGLERLLATPRPAGYEVEIVARGLGLAYLSTRHTQSSRGLPVLVVDGQAYGPGDLPGVRLVLTRWLADSARRAGWQVEEVEANPEIDQY